MRRPNRSIDTFDISLMAVVTKAMGAFLVLMLVLLPYYTPNPKSKDKTEELIRQLQAIKNKVEEVSRQMAPASGSATPAMLGLKQVADNVSLTTEALSKLQGLLNNAFAEIDRLEGENKQLRDEIEQLKKQVRDAEELAASAKGKTVLAVFSSTGCEDVVLTARIMAVGDEKGLVFADDESKSLPPEWALYYDMPTSQGGMADTRDQQADSFVPSGSPAVPFISRQLNSFLAARYVSQTGRYLVAVVKRDKSSKIKLRSADFYAFAKSAQNCSLVMTLWLKEDKSWYRWDTLNLTVAANAFAGVPIIVEYDGKQLLTAQPSAEEIKWLDELVLRSVAAQTRTDRKGGAGDKAPNSSTDSGRNVNP